MSTNTADKLKALQEKNALNSINKIEAKLITLKQQAKEISDAKSRASLKGDKGDPGEDGEDGREIELRKTEEYIQWKYTDEIEWQNLVSLEELKGEKGDKPRLGYDYIVMHGKDGHDGRVGDSGYTPIKGVDYFDGEDGLLEEKFETVSKNLKSYPYTLNYGVNGIDTIIYDLGGGLSITKTFNYVLGILTTMVLSGDTPSGIELTKTLIYTGVDLTSVTYS